jgi:starch synthase
VNIVMVSSEAVPFAKTGGLADVVTGLSRALDKAGHNVLIVLPHHRRFISPTLAGQTTGRSVAVNLGMHTPHAWVRESRLPESRVRVLLIDHPGYFDRAGLYVHDGADYPDNAERFIFFSRAALEACTAFGLHPDVLHVHDWQTALIPALLAAQYRQRGFERTASVLTLHNMAFQGNFPRSTMSLTGLPWELFTWDRLEYYGHVNLLKAGCVFADKITTVSPTYAREITTPQFGYGLEGILKHRGRDLVGILNGVDTDDWNPQSDRHLHHRYDVHTVERGKGVCKRELQRELGLSVDESRPLIGMVSRLTDQKGLDLLASRGDELLQTGAQFALLGAGDRRFEEFVRQLARKAPQQVAAVVGYSDSLAHRIEAGADLFLMPSRFEPCGLNQMYSLMYGTLPLVHAVGGLADSVVNLTPETLADGTATGFVFYDYSPEALLGTLGWALEVWRDRETWKRMQRAAMSLDLSWSHSAEDYVGVYQQAVSALAPRTGVALGR